MHEGYSTPEVAKILGLSEAQVRSYVRSGFLEPERLAGGRLQFSFSDLVFLRAAKGLVSAAHCRRGGSAARSGDFASSFRRDAG